MRADELVVGRRYLLGFGPVDALTFEHAGHFEGAYNRGKGQPKSYRFVTVQGRVDYITTNPERDVREIEE